MISGNRRIPLVYSNQKSKEPQYFRYVPEKLQVIKFSCICTPIPPVNVVGVGTGANTLLYSRDGGITWTGLGNSIFSVEGNCAAWNGTMWVAGGNGASNILAYSYDGITWNGLGIISTGPSTTLGSCTSIVWTGTKWVAVDGGGQSATSTDGITWTGFNGTNNGTYPAYIATNGSRIIGIPSQLSGSLLVAFSTDGETWGNVLDSSFSDAGVQVYRDILWDGSKFIILVGSRTDTTISKFYSSDGITWSTLSTVGYVNGTNIGKTTGNLYISRGTNPDSTEKSTNGTTWTTVTNPSFSISTGIPGTIFGTDKNIFVCGYNNNTFIYSTDGISWTNSSTGLSGNFKAGFFRA